MLEPGQEFCGLKEAQLERARLAKWTSGACSYAFAAYLGAIGREVQLRLTDLAVQQFVRVCGVKISKGVDPDEANIVIGASRRGQDREFDGPAGVLAYAGLPVNGSGQVPLMFDLDEQWTPTDPNFHEMADGVAEAVSAAGTPTIEQLVRGIQYFFVCLHEMGHAMGLSHAAAGSANVMAPVYNPAVTKWGAWDLEQLQARYGNPTPTTPPGGGPGADVSSMRVLIGQDKYRLVRE